MNEETKKFNLLQTEQKSHYSLGIQIIEGSKISNFIQQTNRVGYTDHSHLTLDAPMNEEKQIFNLLETEKKSHSDSVL